MAADPSRAVLRIANRYTGVGLLAELAEQLVAARAVYDAGCGAGPLQRHLDDPTVEEI